MKILYIFKGENLRNKQGRGIQSSLDCIKNWKETLFLNHLEYDIAFITYDSPILNELIDKIKPKYVNIYPRISHENILDESLKFMSKYTEYDRYVILRFDILYRVKILEWPKWKENGIIIVNKDVHWPKQKLYADIVFIVDRSFLGFFSEAFYKTNFKIGGHGIGQYLFLNKIDFHLMYEDYYHMTEHPLHSILNLEKYPELDNYIEGKKLYDISYWN